VHDLLTAARTLGVVGLEHACLKFLGAFESRVRRTGIKWSEVVDRVNNKDEVLIVIDGMVMDVTRWLIHHPGGNVIIPEQAVLLDGTVYFEVRKRVLFCFCCCCCGVAQAMDLAACVGAGVGYDATFVTIG
jgi:hypothetical protein